MPTSLTFTPGSPSSVAAFLAVCAFVVLAFLLAVGRSAVREGRPAWPRVGLALLGTVLWLGTLGILVHSGWAEAQPMPRLPFVMGLVLAVSILIGLSPVGGWLAAGPSLGALVAFQGFRLPLELVLHTWANAGVIPRTMTWDGSNFDIVTGLLALVLAPWTRRHRWAAWMVNGVGLVLLANVIRVAARSSPLPSGWSVTPPLLLPFHLPYALILPVCIGGALIGHIALTRALMGKGPDMVGAR